jgi:hypothetical protein
MTPLSLALAAQVLAAAFAILIARRRSGYLPAAVALTLIAAIDVLERLLAPTLDGAPIPYQGLARLFFHVETASRFAGDAIIAGLAVVVAVAPEHRRRAMTVIGAVWLLASVIVAALYPSPLVRGPALGRIYFASVMLGICVGTIAMVTWAAKSITAKRSPGGSDTIALWLLIFDANVAFVPFSPLHSAPFSPEGYSGVQVFIIWVFSVLTAGEVIAWRLILRGSRG